MQHTKARLLAAITWMLFLASGCTHLSQTPAFPERFAQRFEQHPTWVSTTVFGSDAHSLPLFDFVVTKTWGVKKTETGELYLENQATTAPHGMYELLKAKPLRIFPRDGVSGQLFLPATYDRVRAANLWSGDDYSFRDLDGTRFEILVNGGIGRVVFMPEVKSGHVARDLFDNKEVGIWTTPFGPSSELISYLMGRTTDPDFVTSVEELEQKTGERRYLHHDITSDHVIMVYVSTEFPRTFLIPLKNAADRWNTAIGKRIFRVHLAPKELDYADCFSARQLCIRWQGDKDFSYTGPTAFTELAHHPASGLIHGGVISVINNVRTEDLIPMPAEMRREIVAGNLQADFVARAVVNSSTYAKTAHPSPNALMERLFLHELGHFNGLGHNFAATATSDFQSLSSSAMAYLPFPVAHKMTHLGPVDLAMMDMIYRQKKPATELPFCATSDALFPFRDNGRYFKPYACEVNAIGPKADWYLGLAAVAANGVFVTFPDIRDLPAEIQARYKAREHAGYPPSNILTHLGYALAKGSGIPENDEKKIVDYLCAQKDSLPKIKEQLLLHHQYVLVCKKW